MRVRNRITGRIGTVIGTELEYDSGIPYRIVLWDNADGPTYVDANDLNVIN